MISDSLLEDGLKLREQMFGEAGAAGTVFSTTELTDKMQELVTRWCFGDIWQRDGLTAKERSMITIGMLIALGKGPELNIHMRGGLANGVTAEQLREISLHAVLYCGIPAANDGLRTLGAILENVDPDSDLLKPAARPDPAGQ